MNALRWQYARLFELLAQLAEDRLSDTEEGELRELLIADPVARGIYRQYQVLLAGLSWECTDPAEQTRPQVVDSGVASAPARQSDVAVGSAPFGGLARPIVRPILGLYRGTAATLSRPVFWSICIVGALFCLYAGALLWNLRSAWLADGTGGDVAANRAPRGPGKGSEVGGEGAVVATIRETDNVSWSGRREAGLPPAIQQGERLQIESGLVELELEQGTKLLVEGPAEWSIDGQNNATLKRGKLVAKVPPQATGFTLDTPHSQIVDLGTEFGVEVSEQGVVDVQVLAGKVDVNALRTDGKPCEPIRLVAGESARVRATDGTKSTTVERISAVGSTFDELLTRSKSASPLDRWHTASRLRQRDASLVAYYNFEDRDRTLRNAVADQLHGLIVPTGEQVPWTQGRWYGKRALAFGDGFATVTVPHEPGMALGDQWSFALWLRLDQLQPAITPVLCKGSEPERQCSLWIMPESGGTLHFSVYDREGVNHFVNSTTPLALNRWSFVVGTYERGTLRLYQNGAEVGTAVQLPGPAANSDAPLVLGRSLEANYPQIFTGAIDEFALYSRALSATEIEQFFHEGRPE